MFPPSPPVIKMKVAVVHESVVKVVVSTTKHWPLTDHGRRRRKIGTSESMVVAKAVHWNHSTRCESRSGSPATSRDGRDAHIAPLPGDRMAATHVIPYKLVAAPRTLNHFDCLAISEASVACRTGVWRCNQGLVRLAIGTIEEV